MAICVGALINEIHPVVIWGRFVCIRFPTQERVEGRGWRGEGGRERVEGLLRGRDEEQVVVVLVCWRLTSRSRPYVTFTAELEI